MRHSIFAISTFLITGLVATSSFAQSDSQSALFAKILSQGVPEHGLRKIFEFNNRAGESFTVNSYSCSDKPVGSVKPCDENKRTAVTERITIQQKEWAVVLDFMRPSTEKRLFLINLKTGDVQAFLGTHGKNSGATDAWAYKFSNIKDSKQSSLGMYVTGDTYVGHYGETLRMYGIEKSNDQAYSRDIVMHGAPYVTSDWAQRINSETKKPYGRLGVSWGCPAVSLDVIKKLIPLLKGGALIYLDQPDLAEEAMSGKEVGFGPVPLPSPRPNIENGE